MESRQQSETTGKVTHLKPARTKADTAFAKKLEALIVRPLHTTLTSGEPMPRPKREPLDREAVVALFNEYGAYLNLIGMDGPTDVHFIGEFVWNKGGTIFTQPIIKSEET